MTKELDLWIKLFKKNFKFTGGEITKEFLFSTGHLKGAHNEKCPTFKKIEHLNPKWKNFSKALKCSLKHNLSQQSFHL